NTLTLGNTTSGAGAVWTAANRIYLTKITTPGATQIQDVKFNLDSGATPTEGFPTARYAAVIYSDSAGSPDTLMNFGGIVTGASASTTNESIFLNPTNLDAATDYWIGIFSDTALPVAAGPATGEVNVKSFPATFSNGPPPTASGVGGFEAGRNFWADLTTS